MFTGLVTHTGKIIHTDSAAVGALKIEIQVLGNDFSVAGDLVKIGESIAINGVCLTVVSHVGSNISFDAGPETLAITTLNKLNRGSIVNLERALKIGSRLGGHWVQGHVDGVGQFLFAVQEAESWWVSVFVPAELTKYCIKKGSITVDGISLTIADMVDKPDGSCELKFQVIPHTWKSTNLSILKPNDALNIEVDVLGKWAERLLQR